MNPFASALAAYHGGDFTSDFLIRRDDGFEQLVPASVFFSEEFPDLEKIALQYCRGSILDVGAAAGRHSLELLRHGHQVTALDILPEMKEIMQARGVPDVVIEDIRSYGKKRFDTLLMLMNGIGMVGNFPSLDPFLSHAHSLLTPGGQILCDSIDVEKTENPTHVAYRERNVSLGMSPGQQTFTIRHGEIQGEPFDWLHLGFHTLSKQAERCGWRAKLLTQEPSGRYLALLTL